MPSAIIRLTATNGSVTVRSSSPKARNWKLRRRRRRSATIDRNDNSARAVASRSASVRSSARAYDWRYSALSCSDLQLGSRRGAPVVLLDRKRLPGAAQRGGQMRGIDGEIAHAGKRIAHQPQPAASQAGGGRGRREEIGQLPQAVVHRSRAT